MRKNVSRWLKSYNITKTEIYISLGFLFIVIILLPILLTNIYTGIDYTVTGSIGDTLGGITAPFLSVLGSILVYLAFKEQIKSNNLIQDQFNEQQFENKLFKMFDIYNDNVKRLSFISRRSGKKYNDKYVFTVLYYDFLKIYKEIENYNEKKKIVLTEKINSNYREEILEKFPNVDIDNFILLDLSYMIIFYGVGNIGRENITAIIGNKLDVSYLKEVLNYVSCKPAYQDEDSIYYQRWKNIFIEFEDFLSPCNDKFDKYYSGNQNNFGHYYRQLFMTFNYINDLKNKNIKYLDKWNYAKLLRSQFSNHEQIFLFLNSISSLGRDWELNVVDDENKKLITKYDLIKNIPKGYRELFNIEKFYPNVEFEDNSERNEFRENLEENIYK
ncbi:hypothetical protein IV494_03145 [Kaistella sp. G5-32]|uniref:Phage abortive infection protein n=1 Tax=Kaistella gelatinilytica TaxID=2787636 RepID=A0ABS0F8Y3_9FLAO|nr:putative phage abortive infection protein [Kaistella gelatinilytica]MBF8456168.1 hypothetical protein [Kaistella gelatinilytica]